GRVVLVDFWTYACINCIRTLPHVNRWAEQYTPQGLTVVGVHTPEFPFERLTANVEAAMRRHGVKHPVAQDNRYGTWKAYSNQYWPAAYLIDAQGRIRYKHFGEGEYERTEAVIRALLAARS
ncbi:MAG: redoxin domain-containing protein, partial [Acidovorax sp.]|nr:redoxin domain-containing protein [Acidovorax sp.]